jgi:hypothetical protein
MPEKGRCGDLIRHDKGFDKNGVLLYIDLVCGYNSIFGIEGYSDVFVLPGSRRRNYRKRRRLLDGQENVVSNVG